MNTKTIEEIIAAVLADLQRICAEPATEIVADGMKIECEGIGNGKRWLFRWVDEFGRTGGQICCVGLNVQFYSGLAFRNAYRLLGLEARDAVADLELELYNLKLAIKDGNALRSVGTSDLYKIIDAERARAAKLVEALEEIWGMTQNLYGVTLMSLSTDIAIRSEQATTAHKEGGAQG